MLSSLAHAGPCVQEPIPITFYAGATLVGAAFVGAALLQQRGDVCARAPRTGASFIRRHRRQPSNDAESNLSLIDNQL